MILWMRQRYVKNGIIKSKTLHLQGVYINCQKLMSLCEGNINLILSILAILCYLCLLIGVLPAKNPQKIKKG